MNYFTVFALYHGMVKTVLLQEDTPFASVALEKMQELAKRKNVTNIRLWSNVYNCWVPTRPMEVVHV